VAIKILDKKKIEGTENGPKNLITEIKVHWAIEECDTLLRLLELYEDEFFVYMVLEY
jgi:serine/threonine protein kinase